MLVDRLSPTAVNYQALQKLVEVLYENPNDEAFRDKLCNIYQHHLQSKNFSWHTENPVALDVMMNTAYHFAIVLSAYENGYQKWKALFFSHRVRYEGWVASPADYKLFQRESFLLSVGIGMAYCGF